MMRASRPHHLPRGRAAVAGTSAAIGVLVVMAVIALRPTDAPLPDLDA